MAQNDFSHLTEDIGVFFIVKQEKEVNYVL